MRRLCALVAVFVLCAPAIATPQQTQPTTTRPNVVLIITDDVGYGDIGSYGAANIRTPNIDSLARDGVRLTDFYANGPLCSPTRAALIMGRYQQRYEIEAALGGAARRRDGSIFERGLAVTGRSLPQLLKNDGYATALVGKWHLGYVPEFSPVAHGFDYFFGFKAGYTDYYQHTDGAGDPDLWENDTLIEQEGYLTDLITERSVAFIEQNADRPFFIDVSYNATHWPYQVPDRPSVAIDNARHLQTHDDNTSTRADYVAMMERADDGIGEVLRTLDRLGLSQNTLVIFTNDNGGEWLSSNAPLFHRKWTLWEGGIRVPTILRWPGRIPAGRVSDQVGITMDLTATVLAATNTPVPAELRLEGIDLLPILEGRAPEVERTLFWRTRAGNQNQRAVRKGEWKLLIDGNHAMLFNVRRDVGERNDLAGQRQDISHELRPLLREWERDVNAEAKANSTNGAGGGN